jgi:biopolymer transport protein ExbD
MLHAIAFTLVAVQPNQTKHATRCETASRSAHSVTVAVDRNNEIFLSGKSVHLTAIRGEFMSLARRYPHAYVSIEADAKASYGTVLQAADAAKSAGLDVGFSP